MVQSLRRRRRRQTLQQAVAVSGTVVGVLLAVTWLFSGGPGMNNPAIEKISCTTVWELAPRYASGELDQKITQQVRRHLTGCNRCRERYHAEFPRLILPAPAVTALDPGFPLGFVTRF